MNITNLSELNSFVESINTILKAHGATKRLVLTCNDKKVSISQQFLSKQDTGALDDTLAYRLTIEKARRWLVVFHSALLFIPF